MTGIPQQFCVRWNSHLGSLGAAFPQLLAGQRFVDVTLACDGHQVHCHRLVLAACSSYFESLLSDNPCKHPIIILPKDVRLWEIQALVDFMYKGQVNVSQAGLAQLLKCAETLQIRGLCGTDSVLNDVSTKAETIGAHLPSSSSPNFTLSANYAMGYPNDGDSERDSKQSTSRRLRVNESLVKANEPPSKDSPAKESILYSEPGRKRLKFGAPDRVAESELNSELNIKHEEIDDSDPNANDECIFNDLDPTGSKMQSDNDHRDVVITQLNNDYTNQNCADNLNDENQSKSIAGQIHEIDDSSDSDAHSVLGRSHAYTSMMTAAGDCSSESPPPLPATIYKSAESQSEYLSLLEHKVFLSAQKGIRIKKDLFRCNDFGPRSPVIVDEADEFYGLVGNGNAAEAEHLPSSLKFNKNSMSISVKKLNAAKAARSADGATGQAAGPPRPHQPYYPVDVDFVDESEGPVPIGGANRLGSLERGEFFDYEKDVMKFYNEISGKKAKFAADRLSKDAMRHAVVLRSPRGNQIRTYTTDALYAALMDVKAGESIYRASQMHKVPRKTLRNWMKRWDIKSAYPMPYQLKQAAEKKRHLLQNKYKDKTDSSRPPNTSIAAASSSAANICHDSN